MVRNYLRTVGRHFSALFPPACAGCDGVAATGLAFCAVCAPVAHRIQEPCCSRCQVPMDLFRPTGANSLCSRCQRQPPAFDSVHALWEYDGSVADAIRRIKYGGDLPALRALCRGASPWLSQRLSELGPDLPVIPVPAHPADLQRRGFHLPSLALRFLSLPNPILTGGLRKERPTPRQATLALEARHRNLIDAFRWHGPSVESKIALLFDDVLTTGATADAASRALKLAGFDSVHIFVFARAPFISGSKPAT